MCTLKAMQLMVNIVELLSQLRSAKIHYISNVGTQSLKSIDGTPDTQIGNRFNEIVIQTFRNIVLLIKENKSDDTIIKNSINYISELLSIIDIPNFGRPNIESILNSDIQEAIDSAQYSNNSELRDLLISCKSKFNI